MKLVTLGRRSRPVAPPTRSRDELALIPALEESRWQVPDHFNFTRDVVEALAVNRKREALTFIGADGVIEPRTFFQVEIGSARWATVLREHGVHRGDRMLVLVHNGPDWLEIMLAGLKVAAVTVPSSPALHADDLEASASRFSPSLIVADRAAEDELSQLDDLPRVLYLDEVLPFPRHAPTAAPTEDTSAKDLAFILPTLGRMNGRTGVMHTHGATFAARVAAEHWLDARPGDAIWCTADASTPAAVWNLLLGPWSRGATAVLHQGDLDPLERLGLLDRLGVTVLCQTPAEYQALATVHHLARRRPLRLRRLVCTGDYLPAGVTEIFEEAWGLTIHNGYGQAETGILVAETAESEPRPGSIGLPLPGYEVSVIDEKGRALESGVEGDLALRDRPPTLFAGYWDAPEETKGAFRGDWYVTGDRAIVDEDGYVWFLGREAEVITSRGDRFPPFEVEEALLDHAAVAESAAVGIRDLERGGQFVRAFVVLQPGVARSDELEVELREHAGRVLPDHKVPREIEFVEALPTTPAGKIDRAELSERPLMGTRPVQPLSSPPLLALEPEPESAVDARSEAPPPARPPGASSPAVRPDPELERLSWTRAETPAIIESEPVARWEPVAETEPGPPAIIESEPVATWEPVIETEPEPEPPTPEPVAVEPAVELEPPPASEPRVAPEQHDPGPDAAAAQDSDPPLAGQTTEPEPALDPTLDQELIRRLEPIAKAEPVTTEPPQEPDATLSPERTEPKPETEPEPAPPAPYPELGLPPVTDFRIHDERPTENPRPKRTRPPSRESAAAEKGEKGTRSRGKSRPVDESDVDELTWIRGLSSRLSSYSLSDDLSDAADRNSTDADRNSTNSDRNSTEDERGSAEER